MNTNQFSRLNLFFRNHPVWRWIVAIFIILFASYTIMVPIIVRWQIEKWMKENGEDSVKIERVTFNPFIMKLRVHSLFAEGFQKGKIAWKRMAFEIDAWPLHKQRIVINDFVLRDALLTVQQTSGRNWVIGGIPIKTSTGGSNRGKGKKGWEFGVSKIELTNVQIRYRGPGFNQKILIREANVDTFQSWKVEKKSSFSVKALISGGEVAISGSVDPQGGDRSVVSSVRIVSLPLKLLRPVLQNSGLSGVDGLLNADFKAQGTLRSKKRYSLNATGKGEITSISTGIAGLPYTVDVSGIVYNGAIGSTDSLMMRFRDQIIITDMVIRDTLKHVIVLQLANGTIGDIKVSNKSMSAGTTRMEVVKTFAYGSSSGSEHTGPFAVQAGVFAINGFSISGKRPEIVVDAVTLQALDASLVRDEDGVFRISKQLPVSKKGKTRRQTKSAPLLVSIKNFIIDGQSQVEMMDLSMEPQVTIQATDLHFTLNDLSSSKEKTPGRYSLTATIRPQATLKAEGTIGPIFPSPDLTIQTQIENFNMPQLSSYMLNLFGYEIDSGRLDGITSGKMDNRQLDLVSKVTVNQLEITPEPSQSVYDKYEDAFMGMSLESALSIITDKNGDVNLTIPVNGNLSDPKFNFADVLSAAIVNSILGGLNAVYYDSLQ